MPDASSGDERSPRAGEIPALARHLLDDIAEVRAVIDGLVRDELVGTARDQLIDSSLDSVERMAEALRDLIRGAPDAALSMVTDAGAMRTVAAD